jgi:hypothetical protein
MYRRYLVLACVGVLVALPLGATEPSVPVGKFGRLDHVFLIIMENETDTDIIGNPNAPFINAYARQANQASNYFAVGHPSAPNYLAIIGGSNFGLKEDYWPDWAGMGCVDHAPNSRGCEHPLPPIAAAGLDNAVVATARDAGQCNGQISGGGTPITNNCALHDYPASMYTPESIADQLVRSHKSWKSYQESLPTVEPALAGVNYSDGAWSNLSPAAAFAPAPIQKLYAVKHNPFAYFRNIQVGERPELSLQRVADFDGPDGLWANLQGQMPDFALIVPNQCHDMHGEVKGGTAICGSISATQSGLLMAQGDATLGKIVTGIKASPAWKRGRNAIVLVWDENDFTNAANRVVMLVETSYGANGHVSTEPYDHYSLLRTLEAGFGLHCLNHACDATSKVMNDLFGG